MSATYDLIADLPLRVDEHALEGLSQEVTSGFVRQTTLIRLRGAGHEGVGEDVVYDGEDHDVLQTAGPVLPLAGEWTLASFADHLSGLELFPRPPVREVSQRYRTWAYESAALDLALQQAGTSLAARLGRRPRPVSFVVSLRLGEPPTLDRVHALLARDPGLRLKLDPTSSWDDALIADLVATGAVDSVDFKGLYAGTVVDQPPDPALYERVLAAFPDAWVEDVALTDATRPVVEPHAARLSWDAPIHAVADIEALPYPPRMVNVKPSRIGGLRELCTTYDHCAARGIGMYGGGQFELGVGRGHVQLLAALFHPDTPNDVAPGGYNAPQLPDGLPPSPLAPAAAPTGFAWIA